MNFAIRLKVVLLQIHIKPTFADVFGDTLSNLNHSFMTQLFCNSSDNQSRGNSNNIENYMPLDLPAAPHPLYRYNFFFKKKHESIF